MTTDPGQLLNLPLVLHEVMLAEDSLHEDLDRWIVAEQRFKLGIPKPLGEARRRDDRPALLEDREAVDHSLDRLVEGRVERVSTAARHHDVHRLGDLCLADPFDKMD